MRAVIQRVSQASVTVASRVVGQISAGLVILLAVEEPDGDADIEWLAGKILKLRVFDDDHGVMNRSVTEAGGGILLISQFTLFASTRKGNRPSYLRSAPPAVALGIFNRFARQLESDFGQPIQTGEFGAEMDVSLVNDGPVTLIIDTRLRE
jgi:D-tyrosyl-tRNA(Tyr) deacylase